MKTKKAALLIGIGIGLILSYFMTKNVLPSVAGVALVAAGLFVYKKETK